MTHPLIWAEIDLSAIAHNVRQLRRITNEKARLMVAVKADGYGHGAIQAARTAVQNGADQLGVARLDEGVALRNAGIREPILIFGYTPAQDTERLLAHDLMPTLYHIENAKEISAAAMACHRTMACHIKVDSGMGRLGVPCDALRLNDDKQSVKEIIAMADLQGINPQGIFTHFATADAADKRHAREQFARFQRLLTDLESNGLRFALKHAANSGAIIDLPETHLDMVRAGIAVYGLYPSRQVDLSRIELHPALTLKANIIHLKQVPAGTPISYGSTWKAHEATTIATIPVGYGDGFSRRLSNRGQVLVNGQRAPIVGRVCMDLTMLDVGHIDGVQMEDEVVLIGRQGDDMITADEIAGQLDTINYEVVTALMDRVERIYR